MPQISLYMDEPVMQTVRAQAALQGVSLSRFIGSLVKEYAQVKSSNWPAGYWESAYGCLSDQEASCMAGALETNCLDASCDDACDWFQEA